MIEMDNKIRTCIQQKLTTSSTRIWSTDPIMTEVVGKSGQYEYVEFAAEYTAFSQRDLENIVRAAELHQMGTMIKVDFQNRGYIAQKAVASGFQSILFADHCTPEEVEESIRMIKPMAPGYDGRYGFPTRRFSHMGYRASQCEHMKRLDDVVLCFMIEKREAMNHLKDILAIPGVDMLQFGPSDYSMSMGWNRAEHCAELREIEEHMIRTALEFGVRPRCEINSSEEAEYYRNLGVKDFSMGDEVRVLERYWTDEGKRLNQIIR